MAPTGRKISSSKIKTVVIIMQMDFFTFLFAARIILISISYEVVFSFHFSATIVSRKESYVAYVYRLPSYTYRHAQINYVFFLSIFVIITFRRFRDVFPLHNWLTHWWRPLAVHLSIERPFKLMRDGICEKSSVYKCGTWPWQ